VNTIVGLSALFQCTCCRPARRTIGQHSYYAGALAAIGRTGMGAAMGYSSSTRNSAEYVELEPVAPVQRVVIDPVAAGHLIAFYNALPIEKPQILGNSPIEQAMWIKTWMEGEGNPAILNCEELDLFHKNLAVLPPEIGLFRNLLRLNLCYNNLTILPDEIGQLQALTELDLSHNQLAALPAGIGQLRALTGLNLSYNQLAALPVWIGQLRALTGLCLSRNLLVDLPAEIGQLHALTALDLSVNWPLTVFPAEILQLQALTMLNLSQTNLTVLPAGIWQLRALTILNLSINRLVVLPAEVGQLRALTSLYFTGNQLEALPDSLFNLPANCVIDAENNPFNPIQLAQFQQRLIAHRVNNPGQGPRVDVSIRDDRNAGPVETLATRLQGWSQEFEAAFPQNEMNAEHWNDRTADFTPLLSLEGDEFNNLNKYLRRLRETQDYRDPNAKNNLILRVERMVQLACRNPEFKQNMLALMAEGLTSCGDRVLITFNESEIQWQFHHKPLTNQEFAQLAIRASRYEYIKKHAKAVAEAKGLGDQIETILAYHIGLRDRLALPITTQGMLYPGMSGVDEDMLDEAEGLVISFSNAQLLEQSEHWQSRQKALYAMEARAVNEKFGAMLVDIEEYYDLSQAERVDWLLKHTDPELHAILGDKAITHYDAAARAVMWAQECAIARLGTQSSPSVQELSREEKY